MVEPTPEELKAAADAAELERLVALTAQKFPKHDARFVRQLIKMYVSDPPDFDKSMETFQAVVLDKHTVDDEGYVTFKTMNIIKPDDARYSQLEARIDEERKQRAAGDGHEPPQPAPEAEEQ